MNERTGTGPEPRSDGDRSLFALADNGGVKRNTPERGWEPPREHSIVDTAIALILFVGPLVYLGVWALWLR